MANDVRCTIPKEWLCLGWPVHVYHVYTNGLMILCVSVCIMNIRHNIREMSYLITFQSYVQNKKARSLFFRALTSKTNMLRSPLLESAS